MRAAAVKAIVLCMILGVAACGESARLSVADGAGPSPQLPEPVFTWFPTVNVADAVGWEEGETPIAAQGYGVRAFAEGLDHPRWLYVLPNGDVLVAESNAPEREDSVLRGWIVGLMMARAGASTPSADRITLLRDADGDGVAEIQSVFLDGLHSPFGMALAGSDLYVANADGIVRFPYSEGETTISGTGGRVTNLPAGRNHHWTKNIALSPDGLSLFATVGSNSNVGENGMDEEEGRAAIWRIDLATDEKRIFASGLRNPNGLAWEPISGALWTTVNERDELGSDLVPDYMTSVEDGGFYGWPYSYFGQHVDTRVEPQRPDLVEKALVPNYALGPHTAALGLAFAPPGSRFPYGAYVGQHGSWNREPPSGYQVVFVPFANGEPSGVMTPILTGFLNENDEAQGRPVGVAFADDGSLLVADDVGNVIWRVTAEGAASAAAPISTSPIPE